MSDQNPYGQNPYDQGPHGQQQPGYGQGYGQAGGYGGPPPAPNPPVHSSATVAMILGIIALGSVVIACGIGLILAPFAWVMGGKAVREIDASAGTLGGRDQAKAGQVMGIIGTVLLVLVLLIAVAVVALVFLTSPTNTTVTYNEF